MADPVCGRGSDARRSHSCGAERLEYLSAHTEYYRTQQSVRDPLRQPLSADRPQLAPLPTLTLALTLTLMACARIAVSLSSLPLPLYPLALTIPIPVCCGGCQAALSILHLIVVLN